jgi:hypothetical protein
VDSLRVRRIDGCDGASEGTLFAETPHFQIRRVGHQIEVAHGFRPDRLDNDLAKLLADELFVPGWLSGTDTFERVFIGVVRTTVCDPLLGWTTFYGNTLARMVAAPKSTKPTEVPTKPRMKSQSRTSRPASMVATVLANRKGTPTKAVKKPAVPSRP